MGDGRSKNFVFNRQIGPNCKKYPWKTTDVRRQGFTTIQSASIHKADIENPSKMWPRICCGRSGGYWHTAKAPGSVDVLAFVSWSIDRMKPPLKPLKDWPDL